MSEMTDDEAKLKIERVLRKVAPELGLEVGEWMTLDELLDHVAEPREGMQKRDEEQPTNVLSLFDQSDQS